jgi:hypothetical protein
MTKPDARRFTVTVHLFREASIDHSPVEGISFGTNHGITPKGSDDNRKQPSGRKRYASCQKGSTRGRRNTAKKAEKPTSYEEAGYFLCVMESAYIVRLQAHMYVLNFKLLI